MGSKGSGESGVPSSARRPSDALAARGPLVAAANASFVDAMKTLVHHVDGAAWHDVGGVFTFATGLPMALFNGCMVVTDAPAAAVADAVAWVRGRDVPFGVWIDEEAAPDASAGAAREGLERRPEPYPGMAVRPLPTAPSPPAGVTVRPVQDVGISAYYAVQEAAGVPPALARRAIPEGFAHDPRVRVFVAELDGEPVGNAIAIRTGRVVGVYAVGTLPAARRRGVGSAATWACLEAGRAWGCDVAVLQSSAMALGLYRRMGFETVVPYAVYVPPRPTEAGGGRDRA
jgi:GNAT superfamily N-acetyltransferase